MWIGWCREIPLARHIFRSFRGPLPKSMHMYRSLSGAGASELALNNRPSVCLEREGVSRDPAFFPQTKKKVLRSSRPRRLHASSITLLPTTFESKDRENRALRTRSCCCIQSPPPLLWSSTSGHRIAVGWGLCLRFWLLSHFPLAPPLPRAVSSFGDEHPALVSSVLCISISISPPSTTGRRGWRRRCQEGLREVCVVVALENINL